MFDVLFALLLFCASVITHVFYCRSKPNSGIQAKAYIFIAVFYMGVYAAGVYLWAQAGFFDPHSLWGLPFEITAGVVFFLLVPVYLTFYTLTQLMSPSKKILISVSRKGSLSYQEILASLEEEDFIETRLSDLCTSGCVKHIEGRYALSASGRNIAAVLNAMQQILGRDMGG